MSRTPTGQHVSAATKARVRDYACTEPSFTIAFAAWELGVSRAAVAGCVAALHDQGVVTVIEPRKGPYGATYAYAPIEGESPRNRSDVRRFGELDDARLAEVGVDAQQRGVIVPHTRAEGPSGKPGKDKARQRRGVRVKRQRQGT
jgi:hypothetical protein